MAALNELIQKIENPELQAQIQAAADKLAKQKKFGLVFEEHLPECTLLYDIPVRKGLKVSLRGGKANETYTVLKIEADKALCLPRKGNEAVEFPVADLVTTAELGDPIYPCLQMLDDVCNAPDSDLWHTLIQADNYHALQLLQYLYAGKVDCIYIDPPYNTGAKDWKYNNDYVDSNDEYRHSKWLSFMQKRLEIAKRLLNPNDSVLIVTIDEKEYLHLGCLLEEIFKDARIQMISSVINPHGANRKDMFARVEEYIYYVFIGAASVCQGQNDMLNPEEKTTRDTWARLLRGGSSGLRINTPNQYYPIFIRETDGKYAGAGEVIPLGIVGLIRSYIEELHRTGRYNALADQVLQFKLSVQVFDPFGKALQENYFSDFTLMSETDLDRQVRNADARLGRYGFPNIYGSRYFDEENPNAHKIDCVLFAADESCRAKLGEYAKNKLREFSGKYRVAVANKSDTCKRKYREIMADSAVVSEQLFAIPENIYVREDPEGKEYENHLLAAPDTGIAKIKLNNWEADLIEEEARRLDFVCWLRNPAKASWALCLPYDINNEKKSFYPDFLIVRSDPVVDYVVDILEPHGNQYADNLPKAKALAAYAKEETRIGRIQLIHKTTGAGNKSRFVRLDLTDLAVRDKVLRAVSNEDLDHIFETDGSFE